MLSARAGNKVSPTSVHFPFSLQWVSKQGPRPSAVQGEETRVCGWGVTTRCFPMGAVTSGASHWPPWFHIPVWCLRQFGLDFCPVHLWTLTDENRRPVRPGTRHRTPPSPQACQSAGSWVALTVCAGSRVNDPVGTAAPPCDSPLFQQKNGSQ